MNSQMSLIVSSFFFIFFIHHELNDDDIVSIPMRFFCFEMCETDKRAKPENIWMNGVSMVDNHPPR